MDHTAKVDEDELDEELEDEETSVAAVGVGEEQRAGARLATVAVARPKMAGES